MNADRRAEARALCDAATPGPWEVAQLGEGENRPAVCSVIDGWDIFPVERLDAKVLAACIEADENFIAAARTLLPEALDALETAEARAHDWCEEARRELARAETAEAENTRLRDALEAIRNLVNYGPPNPTAEVLSTIRAALVSRSERN